jgi:hypothetical protein
MGDDLLYQGTKPIKNAVHPEKYGLFRINTLHKSSPFIITQSLDHQIRFFLESHTNVDGINYRQASRETGGWTRILEPLTRTDIWPLCTANGLTVTFSCKPVSI